MIDKNSQEKQINKKYACDDETECYVIEKGERCYVTYIIPFYTGFFIDIADLIKSSYKATKREIIQKLNSKKKYQTENANGEITYQWFDEDSIGDEIDTRVWQMNENKVYGGSKMGGSSFLARSIDLNLDFIYQLRMKKEEEESIEFYEKTQNDRYSFPLPAQKLTREYDSLCFTDTILKGSPPDILVRSLVTIKEMKFFYHEFAAGALRIVTEYIFDRALSVETYHNYVRKTALVQFLFKFANRELMIDSNTIEEILDGYSNITIFQFDRINMVNEFLNFMEHSDPNDRLFAINKISELDKQFYHVVNRLDQARKKDKNKEVRKQADIVYHQILNEPITREEQNKRISELLLLLNSKNKDHRIEAAKTFGKMKYKYPRVKKYLTIVQRTEKNPDVLIEIERTLEKYDQKQEGKESLFVEGFFTKITDFFRKRLKLLEIEKEPYYTVKVADHFNIKQCLWEHVIFSFLLEEDRIVQDSDIEKLRVLINSSQKQSGEQKFGAIDVSLDPKIRAYPGFGTSLIVAAKNRDISSLNFPRVVEIAEYYYAATDLMDDLMYDKFAEFTRQRERVKNMDIIEDNLGSIKRLSSILDMFLFDIKDSILNFDKNAKQIWRALEQEWYYTPMIDSLNEKSNMLNEKYTEYLGELDEKRSALFNKLALVFTFFAVLSGLLEVWSFFAENDLFFKITVIYTEHPVFFTAIISIISIIFLSICYHLLNELRKFGKIF